MSDIDYTAILPEGWPRARGYSHGVSSAGGRSVHIAGQIGVQDGAPAGGFGVQFGSALERVVTVMQSAGGKAEHITAMRIYVTSINAYREAGAALGEAWIKHLGKHFPAMTLVEVSALLNPDALVEIAAEGRLP
ncbi:MAG: RidA family protein [SAR324 cluster bacterium]|nr:RidA family protein [SAR324 cluster bacterium]